MKKNTPPAAASNNVTQLPPSAKAAKEQEAYNRRIRETFDKVVELERLRDSINKQIGAKYDELEALSEDRAAAKAIPSWYRKDPDKRHKYRESFDRMCAAIDVQGELFPPGEMDGDDENEEE